MYMIPVHIFCASRVNVGEGQSPNRNGHKTLVKLKSSKMSLLVRLLVACLCVVALVVASDMPLPFTRELTGVKPYSSGNDVTIAQELLNRDKAVSPRLTVDGILPSV
jgi:hypothetical protein